MADEDSEPTDEAEDEEQSFRERVEEIRQQQASGDERAGPSGADDPFGGGPEGIGGGMGGGNPFAQMMGGMMGGGGGGGGAELDTERVVQEIGQLREELRQTNAHLERIADSLSED